MAQTLNKEYVVDGQFSQDGIEIKVQSREEEILRELGIVLLDNKVTRSRYNKDETDATILKQAGVSYVNTAEYEESVSKEHTEKKKREMNDKTTMKPLSRTEAEILRAAGVTWLDNMAVINDDDTYCHKLGCGTSLTATETVGGSTVNSTYAERELMRRLKHGWSSTGEDCEECGMPVICKSKGDLLECVICGVVGGEDNYNSDVEDGYDTGVGTADEMGMEGPGVLNMGTNMSTISPSLGASEMFGKEEEYDYQTHHCQGCQASLEEGAVMGEDQCMYCDACAEKMFEPTCREEETNQDELDAVYNEALGRRLFDGWELSTSNCLGCNLPLISEFEGAPIICLRCG
mmetsp:Transcript_3499/g.7726  ORF Transcript_3499/g.7726 Transcript_3499/m.7726 type:complete len:347 (+) Transcript_3499:195-1235(+)|eukprot:CAMPEP_0172323082 /NCGR_PEP_ID=MMETSP1058-20130122/47809_1 /TAXON_ID=83371 /ORGANISM="Detonula confervacea, Strain CCMP 353" /LENGTH=346 /DNA_ID=CAMNT_0013038999 /DNA_START=128 /DNA_END=1168 /DNA_ORIENTATION=+